MFDRMKGMMDQFQRMQSLLQDDHFKAFIGHPKVQELFGDPEIQELMKRQDAGAMLNHPKMEVLKADPEIAALAQKMQASFQKAGFKSQN